MYSYTYVYIFRGHRMHDSELSWTDKMTIDISENFPVQEIFLPDYSCHATSHANDALNVTWR